MDRTQRLIVVLLVLAIMFSGVSIFISFTALNVDVPRLGVSGQVVESRGNADISLVIEPPSSDGGGTG